MKPNDTRTLPETGTSTPDGSPGQASALATLADDLQSMADEARLDYEEKGNLLVQVTFEVYADAAAMARRLLADLEDAEDDPDHDDQQSQEDDRPTTMSVRLSDVHRVTGALIDTLEEFAQDNQQYWEDFPDNEQARGGAAAYRDAAKQARTTQMDLLAAATHPEASILASIAEDLEAEAREARNDKDDLIGDTSAGRAMAYEHAAGMLREHLDTLDDGEGRQEEADPAPAPAPHPLDAAIHRSSHGVIWSNVLSIPREVLYGDIAHEAASTGAGSTDPGQRADHLRLTTAYTVAMLHHLGVDDPWQAMRDEYDRAKEKHGDMTLDNPTTPDSIKYCALMEEVGEVARCLTYDAEHAGDLTTEVTQVGALALAWLATPRQEDQP